TQLQRDIRYIRDFTSYTPTDNSQDSGQNDNKKPNEPPKMPDWTGDPGPELTQEEFEDWGKSILKFSVEVAVLAFLEFVPMGGSATGEYLQGIKSTFLNNFKALNTIKKYFGNNKYIGKLSDELDKANKVINYPTVQKTLQAWDGFLRVAGFNYGMSVFKRGLYKLFPGQEGKIDALLLIYSSWQFIKDPEGTKNAIIDIFTSLMQGQLPDRESFEKIFIFDPAQDK
ncbi:MAG: hypothetical protein Q8R66_02550, partial [Methanobacteriaceae archaeon]|nr:hypothetical protein [Methanobacteriaceae archaeon]